MEVCAQDIRAFSNNIDGLVFLLDKNLKIFHINPPVENFFDIENKQVVARSFLEEAERLLGPLPFKEAAFHTHTFPDHFTSVTPNHAGTTFQIQWSISRITLSPNATLYAILGNVASTNKYNLASNLLNLANLTPGDLYWKNKKGEYLGCNDAVLAKLNFTSVSDIIGKTDADLWPDNAQTLRENDLAVMEGKGISITEETIQIPGQPEMIFTSVKAPLLDKNNQLIGVIGNSLEITAQKKAEEQLKHAKELAERNSQLKTEFIHNTQHDIRTPLSGIYGCSELLMLDEKDPKKREVLQHIQAATRCVIDYCASILEFSKLESGKLPVRVEPLDYLAFLEKVITLERPALHAKNLAFSLHYDIEEGTVVATDSFRLERILINLISNAIKFTPEGSITLHTWLEDHTLCLCIKDTGIGIPQKQQTIIFDIFVRLTISDSSPFEGQGLGLSLVKQFVDDLSGSITVESEENKGSAFTVRLPMSEVAAEVA